MIHRRTPFVPRTRTIKKEPIVKHDSMRWHATRPIGRNDLKGEPFLLSISRLVTKGNPAKKQGLDYASV